MADKFDYKKEYKELYQPKNKPSIIEVPEMNFLMLDGKGDPNGEEYKKVVETLYGVAYTIKMSYKNDKNIEGYFDYVVPPLEGLWWVSGNKFDLKERDNWLWTAMIRQPEFVTEEVLQWAIGALNNKKPEIDTAKVRLEKFKEGLCVQSMHIGPYADEPKTVEMMQNFMEENNLKDDTGNIRKHHEIYLSDPRKADPLKMKTVLRHPVSAQ
ncbi:MAG: GyrI-like domain-containing protein [Clostridiaceae bacterium]